MTVTATDTTADDKGLVVMVAPPHAPLSNSCACTVTAPLKLGGGVNTIAPAAVMSASRMPSADTDAATWGEAVMPVYVDSATVPTVAEKLNVKIAVDDGDVVATRSGGKERSLSRRVHPEIETGDPSATVTAPPA